jgi:hypothetical protein
VLTPSTLHEPRIVELFAAESGRAPPPYDDEP